MISRTASIFYKRIKKKRNPFKYRAKSSKPKYVHLAKRHVKEQRFQAYGVAAIAISLCFLIFLFGSIIQNGYSAFVQTQIQISVNFEEPVSEKTKFRKIIRNSLKEQFPDASSRKEKFMLYGLISKSATNIIKNEALESELSTGVHKFWVPASSNVDMFVKGKVSRDTDEARRKIKDLQIKWLDTLEKNGAIRTVFNTTFFTEADSREPEQAGILGSTIGSVLTIIVCMLLSFPIGVGAAVYLEEFAPKNKLTDIIEVNINNLAAVPSVIFGLLALAVYLNFFGMPRSSSLVGGFALSMLVLPTIVIASRNALAAVPPSIRHAASALGATQVQVVMHHTLPYSLPGIMTGTILGVARALGETAPLLMIGMVAFVADVPQNFTDPATSLPTQIYLWADSPEMGFVEKTSACIIILLVILGLINGLAAYIRKKFEYEW